MAIATQTPANAAETLTAGACAPRDFPEAEIRAALERAGHRLSFWQTDSEEAIRSCREHGPELFLLGAGRPDPRVLECVRALSDAEKATKVVLICKRSGQGDVRKALDAGVRGLVTLDEVEEALPAVIEVVRAGQVSVPGSRRKELRKQILTAREKQILGLVVMGMTNAEIAAKLFLAESTVKSHLSSAFAKLGVSSRSEAASVILDPQSDAGLGILTIPTK
jgi:DNA-binding NarL/FixJ family response regulator